MAEHEQQRVRGTGEPLRSGWGRGKAGGEARSGDAVSGGGRWQRRADLRRSCPGEGAALVVRPIVGMGTAERTWQAWGRLRNLPELSITEWVAPPLIVAPHPDDEILGAAGLLTLTGGEVVAVTDGELSHPGSVVVDPNTLGAARRAETAAALTALGRPDAVVHRLGHPDNAIAEDRLVEQLTALLSRPETGAGAQRWCVVTWRADGHPDHEVVGRAAVRACGNTGARLVEYPIWMWHWAAPDDQDVPWERAARLPLPEWVRARKRAAIAAFESQVQPVGDAPADAAILPPHVVARFDRAEEVFFL